METLVGSMYLLNAAETWAGVRLAILVSNWSSPWRVRPTASRARMVLGRVYSWARATVLWSRRAFFAMATSSGVKPVATVLASSSLKLASTLGPFFAFGGGGEGGVHAVA